MNRTAMTIARVAGLASPLLLAAGAASAAPPATSASFLDGARLVTAERLAPPSASASPSPASDGRELTPVRLRYDAVPGRAPLVVDAFVDRHAVVQIAPGAEASVEAAGVRLVRPLMPSLGLWLAEDEGDGDGLDLAARLQGEVARGVEQAVPDLHLRVQIAADPYTPNDPQLIDQWYLERIGMPEAWGMHRGDPGTGVVVIDSGCDLTHPDLASKLDPGRDLVEDDDDPTYDLAEDGAAHGTACAGLIAAATDNGEGIAGLCPECRLRCVRLISPALLPVSATVEAFGFARETGASVVSNSWGYVDPIPAPQVVADAIDDVFRNGRGGKGALVLFAAGNDDREIQAGEIQALPSVLAIGAITQFDDKTSFTNYGAALDLVAPVGTITTDIQGAAGYETSDYTNLFGGTSSACPVAAGVAGVLVSAAPEKTAAELYEVMIRTARPAPFAVPDESGHDPVYGFGVVDPVAALNAVLEPEVPTPTPPTSNSPAEEEGGCAMTGRSPKGAGVALLAAALAAWGVCRRRR